MAKVRELVVVVPEDSDNIPEIDHEIGIESDHDYEFAGNRDVVYTVPDAAVDEVDAALKRAREKFGPREILGWNFGDPKDEEGDDDE